MPSIKNFEKNKKSSEDSDLDLTSNPSSSSKRRPRDADEAIAKAERIVAESAEEQKDHAATEVSGAPEGLVQEEAERETSSEDTYTENLNENAQSSEEAPESAFQRIRIDILGHELLNVETPEKVRELADAVVEDWKKDGSFKGLPVGHPLAQILAAKGLRKAKDVEKKLEEKGVFAMAQMGLELIKSKLKK